MQVQVYKRCELVLNSTKVYENPFMDVEVNAVFTHEDGTAIALPGFWNGENEWKVRFSPLKAGKWQYSITCTDVQNTGLTKQGELTATPCEDPKTDLEKHGYVCLKENDRHFYYADGTPFFWLGDTHWQMPDFERLHECNCPGCTCGNQFKHLVDDRVKKGFTVYQTYFDSAESDGGGNKRVHHWWTEKYTLINPAAFNETMDIMMEYLADQGMTVAMGFGVHTNTIAHMNSDEKAILAFARYCVARYACYPVVWITAQEITNITYKAFEIWQKVGALVGETDGYHHPNSAHMYPMLYADMEQAKKMGETDFHQCTAYLDQDPWHQFWTLQAGHGGLGRLQPRKFYKSYYETASHKPYIEGECHYEDIHCGGFCGYDASRVGAWQALQSGCAGFTYGVTGVWAMEWNSTDDRGWLLYSPEPWYVGMNKPGSTEMTYLRRFYEYVGFADLEPSFGYDLGAFECRKQVAISHKGQDIFVYYFFGFDTETGLLMGLKPNVKYQARWYDPIHGAFIDLPDVLSADGSFEAPAKPCARDWVLLLNCVDLGAYETMAYPAFIQPAAASEAHPGEKLPIVSIKAAMENPDYPAANLLDEDPAKIWKPFVPYVSQTLIADMGQAYDVAYLNLVNRQENYLYFRFRVYGSLDGTNWDLLAERPHDCVAIGGAFSNFMDPIKGHYRYIKLFLNSRTVGEEPSLAEFNLFAPQK